MTNTDVVLSSGEAAELARLEIVIENGVQTFVQVGKALERIRERRLYREAFGSFEDYCRERWGFSKTQANRLVQSAEVAGVLTPIGVIPTTESQARELARLLDEPDTMRDAWQAAQDKAADQGKPVTAAIVRDVVSDVRPTIRQEAQRLGLNRRPNLNDAASRVVREAIKHGSVYHVPIDAMDALVLAIGKE